MAQLRKSKLALRIFSASVIFLGVSVLLTAFALWNSEEPVRYLVWVSAALLFPLLRVGVPAFPGTMALGFLFVVFGLANFSLAETLFLACAVQLVQYSLSRRPGTTLSGVLFDTSSLAVSVIAAHYVYRACYSDAEVGLLLALAAAGATLAVMSTFPLAIREALGSGRPLLHVWHECVYWILPHQLLGTALATFMIAIADWFHWWLSLVCLAPAYLLYRMLDRYLAGIRAAKEGADILASRHHRTLETFALAIAARFRAANDHLAWTQTSALWLAEDLNLDHNDVEALRIAAMLHDIGTLAVPEQIMCKAGKLTREEFERIKIHPIVGASIIERAEFPFPVAKIVRSHHERWDGQGYPDGLHGEQIPIGARILSVVDCIAALTADRPYRPAVPLDRALSFIASQSGSAFDPRVVNAVLHRAGELKDLQTANSRVSASRPLADDFVTPISDARREAQSTYQLAQELGRSLNLSDVLKIVARRLAEMVPCEALVIHLREEDMLVPRHAAGIAESALCALKTRIGEGLVGRAATDGKPVTNADPTGDLPKGFHPQFGAALAIPLEGATGVLGVVTLYRIAPNSFNRNEERILLGMRSIIASAVENSIRYQQVEACATTDHLTGIPNARSLFQRLDTEVARCRRSGSTFTVLVCDLDRFKSVNDVHGHLMGNEVLQAVARALQRNCREYDFVARMGGDEFVVLLPGLPESAVALRLRHLERVISEFVEKVCPASGVTLSSGQARYPEDGTDGKTLLTNADTRMLASKERRKVGDGYGFDFDLLGEPLISDSEFSQLSSVASTRRRTSIE